MHAARWRSDVTMLSDKARSRKVKKGGVITKDKKRKREGQGVAPAQKPQERLDYEKQWRLVLHNDDWHTFG